MILYSVVFWLYWALFFGIVTATISVNLKQKRYFRVVTIFCSVLVVTMLTIRLFFGDV